MKSDGKVSIIIVTHDNELDIQDCLKSLKKQTYRNFEVIVVDSASCDRTIQLAQCISGRKGNFR